MIDKIVSKYKIFRKIGRGNQVTLYEAYNTENADEKVVVKIFDPVNDEIMQEFKDFAKIMTTLNHPNILKDKEFITLANQPVFITSLLEGQNLKFAVLIKGLTPNENIEIFKQVLDGVNYLHKYGIKHRDIKPENIFLINDYKKAIILDAGVAGILGYDNPSKIGKRIDAPMFLSPEQARGDNHIDRKSDIYSLGVLLYFMYSRKLPFSNTFSYDKILEQIINESIPEIQLNKDINKIIQKATRKNKEERYASVEQMLEDIKKI